MDPGGLCRSDHALLIIDRTVMLITGARVATTPAYHGRVRITLAHHPIIDRLITLRRARLLQLALGRLIGPLQGGNQLWWPFDN